MTVLPDLTCEPAALSITDPVEIAAEAMHTAWARSPRWNETHSDGRPRVPDGVKAQWRREARAAIDALRRAGFMRG